MTDDAKGEMGEMNMDINVENPGKQENFDYDSFWKDLITRFCYYLLKRAVPELYEQVDTTKRPRFLDKEFTDVVNTGDPRIRMNPHSADFVLEIPLKNGDAMWLLFHCEIQGPGGGAIPERMNHYRCLIYAHYRREPVALAVITGGHRKEEKFYAHSHFGTEVMYRYNNLVLSELDDEELQASDNPIDLALYAAKCALKAKKEEMQKYTYLRTLIALLAERGWSREDKADLLLFLERVINLEDKELEKQYTEYRSQLTKEGKIVYIPLGERELAKEIEQRGMEEKAKEVARKLLIRGDYSFDAISEIAGVPVDRVRSMAN